MVCMARHVCDRLLEQVSHVTRTTHLKESIKGQAGEKGRQIVEKFTRRIQTWMKHQCLNQVENNMNES